MTYATDRPTIDALLADRARYETWLEQLAAKATQVPAHVVERVQGDYRARLDHVVAALTDRADELSTEAASLAQRVTALEVELSAKRDARAEDEIRALVGEHDDAAWSARAAEHDAAIAAVLADRDRTAVERDRVHAMLGEATRPLKGTRVVSEVEVEPEPAAPPSEIREPVAPASVDDIDAMAVTDGDGPMGVATAEAAPFADLLPLVPEPVVLAADSIADVLPTPSFAAPPSPRSSRATSFDEIAFLDTVVGRPTPMVTPVVTAPSDDRTAPPAALFEDAPLEPVTLEGGARGPLTTPDTARSLKCQECGWMNIPTEWYCEKCGGELSAF
jgi:hypothetical protein